MNAYYFTDRVRKVLALARDQAGKLKHEYVEPEHILLGLIAEYSLSGGSVAASVLENLNVDLAALRQTLAHAKEAPDDTTPSNELPYTSRSKRVLELAMSEVREMGHNYVGTEHLLLGILLVENRASKALNDEGVTADRARAEVLRLVGTAKSASNAHRVPVFKDVVARVVAAIALLIAALALVVALTR